MKVYSFPRGGFLYEDSSAPAKGQAVNAFLPAISVIPLGCGKDRVIPVVSGGEIVREGALVGRALSGESSNAHASVPGRVLRKVSWKDKEDFDNDALVIRLEGSFDKLGKKDELFVWNSLGGYDLLKIFTEMGITEMEDAGRNLSDIISLARRTNEKITLVVRCIFDDPWLVSDFALCSERMEAVIQGAAIVAKASFKVSQIIFAVSYPEKELGQKLLSKAQRLDIPSSLILTGSRYPQRNNDELETTLKIFEKKEGQSLGSLLILGPAVLAAAFDAVVHKKPVLERYVAVGGTAVKKPQIMKARIGTRIIELIEQCEGFKEPPVKIVKGSPLSGKEVFYADEPVGKTCFAVAAMGKSQASSYKMQNCINCGECRTVCPAGLDPQNIYKRINSCEVQNLWRAGCHRCGCCNIVCPSALPLIETILEKAGDAS